MKKLRPFEWVTITYLAVLAAIIFVYRENLAGWEYFVAAHFVGILALVMIANLPVPSGGFLRKPLVVLKDWYILPVILFLYEELGKLNTMVHGKYLDEKLVAMEKAVFGDLPSLWISDKVDSLLIMEIFNIGYFSYYFIFPVLGIALYLQNKERYQHFMFAVSVSFLASYIFYTFFPAQGPCYMFPEEHSVDTLKGYIFTEWVVALQKGGSMPTAAFPSSHVSLSVVVQFYAFKYTPRLAKILLPFILVLIPATFYGKFHFIVDAIAGVAWGLALCGLTVWLWNLKFRNIFERSEWANDPSIIKR